VVVNYIPMLGFHILRTFHDALFFGEGEGMQWAIASIEHCDSIFRAFGAMWIVKGMTVQTNRQLATPGVVEMSPGRR